MSEQELWEKIFVATLEGSASPYAGWSDERVPYLMNRAQTIADAGVAVIRARREVHRRMEAQNPIQRPPPPREE